MRWLCLGFVRIADLYRLPFPLYAGDVKVRIRAVKGKGILFESLEDIVMRKVEAVREVGMTANTQMGLYREVLYPLDPGSPFVIDGAVSRSVVGHFDHLGV